MQKASNCEDELCCHSHATWHKTSKSCTCFHNNNKGQACYSLHNSQVHQVHWWLDKGVPRSIQGLGRFPGKYKIWLWHDVHPMIHAPRKCPITLCPKVKEHLNKMECLGVITHVGEPMDWVSSITYVQKANGELHLCLDPCDLNKAICWDRHKIPTVEEVTHEFAHSHYFTKLDAHHGYWSVILDQESSLLTTFSSPFGRYHFLQLPLGLVCSQDIF